MATLLITFVFFVVLFAGMAVGVIMRRKPITGTCGGLNKFGGRGDCEICGGDQSKCDDYNNKLS